MKFYRNVASVMLAIGIWQVANGLLNVALPLTMANAQWSGIAIGAIASAYAMGFMAGAFYAPQLISRIGHIRAFAAAGGLAAAATLFLGADTNAYLWFALRLIFGASAAVLFAVAESWIADATPARARGGVISAYQICGRAGIVIGPFLIGAGQEGIGAALLVAGAFLALAISPVAATGKAQPIIPDRLPGSPLDVMKVAPAAAIAVFTAGAVNAGVLTFIPIWAGDLGTPTEDANTTAAAALVMGVIFAGSMASQWPAGKISDHYDRRYVMAGLAVAWAVISLILTAFVDPGFVSGLILIGLWGATSLAHYGIAVAHAADRADAGQLPAMAAGLLLVWAVGSIIGPLITGALYASAIEMRGVFLFSAVMGVAMAGAMFLRRRSRERAPDAEREDYVNLQATSSALAETGEDETTL
ncbi:MFS transporter [Hyphobacterium sp.]|uniref:MFS transporter n=1 Tax=Hyphobacterium sp. TaxID=2004662 RepID=UPI003BAAF040